MDPIKSALNLFRRLPPEDIESTFRSVALLREDLADELLQHVDFPLRMGLDTKSHKQFILSDFNGVDDSFRSPWSNEYFPSTTEGFYPTTEIREMEENANFLFEKYKEMYYGDGVSSVYMWNNNSNICGCFLIFKEIPSSSGIDTTGSWHSLHLIEIIPDPAHSTAEYRLTSTIQLYLCVYNEEVGEVKQNGSLTRQSSSVLEFKKDEDHLANIGQMIEQMENYIRGNLDTLYLSKNQETVDTIRILKPSDLPKRSLLAELSGQIRSPRIL